jgi:hypothetical protein
MAVEIKLLGTADDADAMTMERTIKGYEPMIREMSASLAVLGDDSTMDTLRRDIDDMNAVAALKTGDRGLAHNRSRR